MLDQPIRVGDFCQFGTRQGTVEAVGLRSTTIRTRDRTVVTVPNAQFSNEQIENFGVRDSIRLYTVIKLRYETMPDQMRSLLAELRALLATHPKVDQQDIRVRLIGFGEHSLDVELFAYVRTTEWVEFLSVREEIYLRIMELVAAAGTSFALPSRTAYLARDHGIDAERSVTAARAGCSTCSRARRPSSRSNTRMSSTRRWASVRETALMETPALGHGRSATGSGERPLDHEPAPAAKRPDH